MRLHLNRKCDNWLHNMSIKAHLRIGSCPSRLVLVNDSATLPYIEEVKVLGAHGRVFIRHRRGGRLMPVMIGRERGLAPKRNVKHALKRIITAYSELRDAPEFFSKTRAAI